MSSLSDRLGALTKDTKKKEEKDRDSKEEDDKSETTLASEHAEEYSLTKQVIIQRDERGYGLTVSGDNPVFVQSVKENGAAARAGVHKGDRILKVNGTLVTKCNHKEVVKLIKSGSYVALTLLGRPSGQSTATPTQPLPQTPLFQAPPPAAMANPESSTMATGMPSPGQAPGEKTAISGPKAVNSQMDQELKMQKISMIRFMYEKECEECEKLTEELRQNPHAHQTQQKLEEKLRLRGRLGDQLYQLTGIPAESHISGPKSPPSGLPPPGGTYSVPSGPQKSPIKRHCSGDLQLTEDAENGTSIESVVTRDNTRQSTGSKHLKTKSMPEPFYNADLPPSGKNVTVSRSNSDSKKQSIENQTDTRDGSLLTEDSTEKLIATVLSSVHDTAAVEHTTNQQLLSSPTQTPEIWDEIPDLTMSQINTESPNTTQGSVTSVSPLREIRPNLHVMSPLQADVIPMEEEEEEVNMDDEHLEDHGPFSDLNRLKHKPAHLAVFLYYLISNSDPSPLLFYMVTEQYTQGSMKELRRWAYEIYSTFLVQSAAIKVEDISPALLESIENVLLHRSDKEDIMRTVFQNARHMAQKQISELLADFRQKRTLGLANLYGDNELSDNMDRAAELKTVESKLLPHLEKCTRDIEKASRRDKAMAWALATIMKQLGVTPAKNSTVLERCQSFISKDKKPFKLGKGSSKKNGHQFVPTHYHSTVYCNHCRLVLWGVGYQGFQCSNCDINVHKLCMEQMHEICSGRRKKEKRSSMLNMLRKTTNPNPAAIKEAQRIHDESSGGHMMTPSASRDTLYRIQAGHEEEEDLEVLRTGGSQVSNLVDKFSQVHTTNDGRPPNTPPRAHSPDLVETDEQKRTSSANLGRSESLNKKRENRRSVRRTRSDVQVDDQTLKSLNQSGSSSNSSLSNRSLDSPSTSAEALTDNHHPPMLTVLQEDSDFEVEPELPPLVDVIPKDQLKKLSKSEKKRQEVINELFYTERAHVRNLKVMDKLFRVPMMNAFNDQDMIDTLFTGIEDLIEVHSKLNNRFKNTRKEGCVVGKVADLLLSSFDGEAGENFKKCAATFCRGQSHALDYLRARQRKEPKLANFIQEASSNPLCHRRELKDLIPMATHRLTKYPLLINSLLKDTSKSSNDYPLLQKAAKCSRDILDYVNQAVREHENQQKLADMQKRVDRRSLDNSNYQNFDLQQYKLVHDGLLTWRISKQKQIQLHVLLLDEHLVLLQKQDDRLILKHQSTSRDDNNKSTHSPIIELSKLMVRPVATDKHAMFLISDGEVGPQIYELVGNSVDAMKKWFKYLSESTSDNRQKAKAKGGSEGSSGLPPRPSSMVVPDTTSITLQGEADSSSANHIDRDDKNLRDRSSLYSKSKSLDNLEKIDPVEVHSVMDTVLTQPSEVIANTVQVNTAEVTNTPSDRLTEQEGIINSALAEKRTIVAEMLGVPVEDFQHISEMAAEVATEKEPRELVLGCLHHADQLTGLVSVCLDQRSKGGTITQHLSDEAGTSSVSVDVANNNSVGHTDAAGRAISDDVTEAGPHAAETGPALTNHDRKATEASVHQDDVYVLASHHLIDITARLKAQLNQLTVALAVREREQERLHTELNEARTQVEQLRRSVTLSSVSHDSRPASYISVTSSASDMEADVAPSSDVSLSQVILHESSVVCQTINSPQDSSKSHSLSVVDVSTAGVPTEQVVQTSALNQVSQMEQAPAKQTAEQSDIKLEDSENNGQQSTGYIEHSDTLPESSVISDTEEGVAEDSDAFEDTEDVTAGSSRIEDSRDTSSSPPPVLEDTSCHVALKEEASSSLPVEEDAKGPKQSSDTESHSDAEDI